MCYLWAAGGCSKRLVCDPVGFAGSPEKPVRGAVGFNGHRLGHPHVRGHLSNGLVLLLQQPRQLHHLCRRDSHRGVRAGKQVPRLRGNGAGRCAPSPHTSASRSARRFWTRFTSCMRSSLADDTTDCVQQGIARRELQENASAGTEEPVRVAMIRLGAYTRQLACPRKAMHKHTHKTHYGKYNNTCRSTQAVKAQRYKTNTNIHASTKTPRTAAQSSTQPPVHMPTHLATDTHVHIPTHLATDTHTQTNIHTREHAHAHAHTPSRLQPMTAAPVVVGSVACNRRANKYIA